MAIIGIVAVDRNFAIGKGGSLPWHYSADLKFFKQTTLGNAVVMGRRTWQSLKKPLPDRLRRNRAGRFGGQTAHSRIGAGPGGYPEVRSVCYRWRESLSIVSPAH